MHPDDTSIDTVLLLCLIDTGFGGLETHVLSLARELVARGQTTLLLVAPGSAIHRRAVSEGIECRALGWLPHVRGQPLRSMLLAHAIRRIAKGRRIRAIHCNNRFEVSGACRAAKALGTRVVFNYHVTSEFDTRLLMGVDAFVSPYGPIVEFVRRENARSQLGLRAVEQLPPLFDAARFLTFRAPAEPRSWFRREFGFDLPDGPIVCCIGNMVSDLEHKNLPAVLKALARLRSERSLPVHALVVGDGPARAHLEGLASQLQVPDLIHFLGFSDAIPDILNVIDVFVLASNREAFGIVLLEAGLMSKPCIAARGTGSEQIVLHGESGLLFENGSVESLCSAIETLVSDAALRARLGEGARRRALGHFVPSAVVDRYDSLYDRITA